MMIEYGRQIARVEADHFADQHSGYAGHVELDAVDPYSQAAADAALLSSLSVARLCASQLHIGQDQQALHQPRFERADVRFRPHAHRCIAEVERDVRRVARRTGDQHVEGVAPGVEWVWLEGDGFGADRRQVFHGHHAAADSESFMPSATAMSWALP